MTFNIRWRPIHVGKAQPHRELVQGKTEGDTEHHGDSEMPLWRASGQRDEARRHEQKDAPKEMMDVQATRCHDEVERAVREILITGR